MNLGNPRLWLQKLYEETGGFGRLFLLAPMTGLGNEVGASMIEADLGLHTFQGAGFLVGAPILPAGDEEGGLVNLAGVGRGHGVA